VHVDLLDQPAQNSEVEQTNRIEMLQSNSCTFQRPWKSPRSKVKVNTSSLTSYFASERADDNSLRARRQFTGCRTNQSALLCRAAIHSDDASNWRHFFHADVFDWRTASRVRSHMKYWMPTYYINSYASFYT